MSQTIIYQTYQEVYPEYMAGYTGHIPTVQKEEYINQIIHKKHIPGYAGYVSSIKSENKFGESYGKETAKSLAGEIRKGADVPPFVRYTSTTREDYRDKKTIPSKSTAELLGISDPHVTYKKPIPIDTINKFFGVEGGQNDKEIIEKQKFEKNKEKFWQFLDTNQLDEDLAKKDLKESHPDMKFDPIPGYQGTIRAVVSENIFGMTYKNSLRKADQTLDWIQKNKDEQFIRSTNSLGPYTKSY